MSKFAISVLVIVTAVAVQGSLFGPFGPFGPFGQAGVPGSASGLPSFFPGFSAYPSPVPAFPPTFGPSLASRALLPAGAVKPYPKALRELLLNTALPADLKEQADQLAVEFDQGNAACDEAYFPFGPTASSHRFCKVLNRVTVELAAQALTQEAAERAAAAAVEQETVAEEAAVPTEETDAVEEAAAVEVVDEAVAEEESAPTTDDDVAVAVEEETTTTN